MAIRKDHVILVNERDEWLGTMEKMDAHRQGILHRAFSVFIMNHKGEMLIQQRADGKYHSGGLWSNACCSHPTPGESTLGAAHRRLQEELGFDCDLVPLFNLKYHSEVGADMVEHEFDHIYLGYYEGPLNLNADEVKDYQYLPTGELLEWVRKEPGTFTNWFQIVLPDFLSHYKIQTT